MVKKEDLIRLQERIRTTKARFEKVLSYRNVKIFREKIKIHKKIIKHIVKAIEKDLEPEEIDKIVAGLREEAGTLSKKTERERYSLEVLLRIIDHPRHLPIIIQYYHQLEEDDKKEFGHPIRAILHIFNEMKKEIYNNLFPNVNNQLKYLNDFISSGNLTHLIEYIQLFREQIRYLKAFTERIHPTTKYIHKVWNGVKSVVKKPAEFADEHKTAVAVFTISISFLILALDLFVPAAGILAGIFIFFRTITRVGEKILHIYHIDHATETLIHSMG